MRKSVREKEPRGSEVKRVVKREDQRETEEGKVWKMKN